MLALGLSFPSDWLGGVLADTEIVTTDEYTRGARHKARQTANFMAMSISSKWYG